VVLKDECKDEITTDHIIPAGARMKYRSNVPKYSEYLFEIYDPELSEQAKQIVLAGGMLNYIKAQSA